MKRRSLVRHFTGTSSGSLDDPEHDLDCFDRVDLKIHGGTVSFIVPCDVTDEEVFQSRWLDRFIGFEVDLGEGYVLRLTVSGDCHGVDARIEKVS